MLNVEAKDVPKVLRFGKPIPGSTQPFARASSSSRAIGNSEIHL